ncbi:hypothetical protein ACR6C2_03940 [Streptomyces sp. INA 01156]
MPLGTCANVSAGRGRAPSGPLHLEDVEVGSTVLRRRLREDRGVPLGTREARHAGQGQGRSLRGRAAHGRYVVGDRGTAGIAGGAVALPDEGHDGVLGRVPAATAPLADRAVGVVAPPSAPLCPAYPGTSPGRRAGRRGQGRGPRCEQSAAGCVL